MGKKQVKSLLAKQRKAGPKQKRQVRTVSVTPRASRRRAFRVAAAAPGVAPSVRALFRAGPVGGKTRAAPRPPTELSRSLLGGGKLTFHGGLDQSSGTAETILGMDRKLNMTSHDGRLTVRFNQPLVEVVSSSSDLERGSGFTAVEADGSGKNFGSMLTLSPIAMQMYGHTATTGVSYDNWFVQPQSPHLLLQALAWSRYRVKNLTFTYCPTGQTFQDTAVTLGESRLRFAFTADPLHPILGERGFSGNRIGYDVLAETPYSVQFAEWNAWTLHVPISTDWMYLGENISSGTATGTYPYDRFSYCGAISCFDSYGISASRVQMTHGMIWWGGEVEFMDPSPLLASIALASASVRATLRSVFVTEPVDKRCIRQSIRSVDHASLPARREETKEEKKDNIDPLTVEPDEESDTELIAMTRRMRVGDRSRGGLATPCEPTGGSSSSTTSAVRKTTTRS